MNKFRNLFVTSKAKKIWWLILFVYIILIIGVLRHRYNKILNYTSIVILLSLVYSKIILNHQDLIKMGFKLYQVFLSDEFFWYYSPIVPFIVISEKNNILFFYVLIIFIIIVFITEYPKKLSKYFYTKYFDLL